MSYLFEFDKDYHSSSDSDYNPDTDSDSLTSDSTDGEYESDVSESELPTTPVIGARGILTGVRPIKMPLAPVKKRPIKTLFQLDAESNSNVRPIKMNLHVGAESNGSCVKPGRPVRERKQPIRYQA
jgi:hypothetical protein